MLISLGTFPLFVLMVCRNICERIYSKIVVGQSHYSVGKKYCRRCECYFLYHQESLLSMLWSAAKQLSNGRGQVTIVGSGLEERLQNRVYGCFKDAALREAFK